MTLTSSDILLIKGLGFEMMLSGADHSIQKRMIYSLAG